MRGLPDLKNTVNRYRINHMPNNLNLRQLLLFWGDITCLYLSLVGTVFFGFWGKFDWAWVSLHFLPFSIMYFFWLIIFYTFGLYDLKIIKFGSLFYTKIMGAILTCLGLGMIFFYLTPFFGITPKTNLVLNIIIFGILFLIWRKVFYALFSSHFLNRTVIIGEGPQTQELTKEIISRPYLGYKLIDLDTSQDLLPQIQEKKIDTLIIPNTLEANSGLTKKLYQCLPAHINFMDWAQAYETICNKIPVSFITHTWFLENLKEGKRNLYNKTKRAVDVISAIIILTLILPFWPLIALFIKLENKGSVIYRQERIGKDDKPFFLLKFRSMNPGAEKETGPVWAKKEDSRATKFGKILRRTHLDELPQMINVLKGEIGLVGPRPERPEFVEKLETEIPYYHIRHLIKPGFTGWAQIKFRYGRTIMDSHEKFQYDLYYLKNRNFFLDLGILLKTLQLFFKKE